ncbi:uncharacterized protein LOC113386399 [Ctenocephalides felis]|uniref:uncharacterized protein LOC113386399 n=1 Tax=Ctenocephalides felis TaxID=7515 RepID=UPI000E6E4E6F|nr:uncharacterized protein LOC113386399 [Ctenocephalides felis]
MGFLLRRRSMLLKAVGLLSAAWFVVAIVMYADDRGSHPNVVHHQVMPQQPQQLVQVVEPPAQFAPVVMPHHNREKGHSKELPTPNKNDAKRRGPEEVNSFIKVSLQDV